MKENKTLLEKIKKMVFGEEEETSVEFVDIPTEDGKVMRVNDVAVGEAVQWVDGEELMEVEDGTYVIEGGASIIVVDGLISEIVEAESEEEEVEEEMESDEKADKDSDEKDDEEKEEFDSNELFGQLLESVEKLAEKVASLETKNAELSENFEAFKKEPTAEPTETKLVFKSEKAKSPIHAIVRNKK